MKLNKLLGTVALCSSLLLAVSCSTNRGFEANSGESTALTAQEQLVQNKLESLEATQTIISTQIKNIDQEALNAAERKIFNDKITEKMGEDALEMLDKILNGQLEEESDLSKEEKIDLEAYKAELVAVAFQAMQEAKKQAAADLDKHASEFDLAPKAEKLEIKLNYDGNKLEVLDSEEPTLVFTNTFTNEGDKVVLSASKLIVDMNDDQVSDLYLNGELISNQKAGMSCVDSECSSVAVVIVSGDSVSKPILFAKVDGKYKQLATLKRSGEVIVNSPDAVISELGRDKSILSVDPIMHQTRPETPAVGGSDVESIGGDFDAQSSGTAASQSDAQADESAADAQEEVSGDDVKKSTGYLVPGSK